MASSNHAYLPLMGDRYIHVYTCTCRESWAHKRLFNLPPQFSRLGTQGPAFLFFCFACCAFCVLCVLEVLSLLSLARMLYTFFFPCTCTCMCSLTLGHSKNNAVVYIHRIIITCTCTCILHSLHIYIHDILQIYIYAEL